MLWCIQDAPRVHHSFLKPMKNIKFDILCAVLLAASPLTAQLTLNPNPARVIGQPKILLTSTQPNLVEGRELSSPNGVAVDLSGGSAGAIYVADSGNNRVLVWKSATNFTDGAMADAVIGQKDRFTTFAQGPATGFSSGLSSPTSVAVDGSGNLYVADSGNNRILRFPRPLNQPEDVKLPDMVIGQANFSTTQPATNEKGLALTVNNTTYRTGMLFDAAGNLYFSDPLNNRVLRYSAASLRAGANAPTADRVFGQPDFSTNKLPVAPTGGNVRLVKEGLGQPAGLALDQAGRLFVADIYNRVVVYEPPFDFNGKPASRIMGVVVTPAGQPAPTTVTSGTLGSITRVDPPNAIFTIGNLSYVLDSPNNRILQFDPVDQWPGETPTVPSPLAKKVYAQADFTSAKPNRGIPEAGANSLSNPVAAIVAAGRVYIADAGNNRVLSFNEDSLDRAEHVLGQNEFALTSPNLTEGREFFLFSGFRSVNGINAIFGDGVGMAVDLKSDPPALYVSDTYNNRILGFRDVRKVRPGDKADLVIGQVDFQRVLINSPENDTEIRGDSGLFTPAGIAVDPNGHLWVADSGNSRVLRFPRPFAVSGPQRADRVIGQASFTSKLTDTTPRTLSRPVGIAFTSAGHLLVSDTVQNRVLFFEKPSGGDFTTGQSATKVFGQSDFLSSTAIVGDDSTGMALPRGIAVNVDDRLYVADTGNHRLLAYERVPATAGITAQPTFVLTGEAPGQGRLNSPHAVAISPVGNEIWVADTRNNRVVRFPRYENLFINKGIEAAVPSNAPLGLTVDSFGNILVGESVNRISLYFPGVATANSASYSSRAISPGQIASVFPRGVGFTFGTETKQFNELPNPIPLPRALADIAVLLNDQPLPLYFVSPGQINFLVPMGNPTTGNGEMQIVRPSSGQIIAASTINFGSASPALFAASGTGSGQIAALNQDGSVNSAANAEARGRVVQLFGTGQGFVPNAPADGELVPNSPLVSTATPQVIMGAGIVPPANVLFSGLAPGLVGVWQINVKIPDTVAPGNSVPVAVVMGGIPSTEGPVAGRPLVTTICVKQ